ncbi:hypothetical protein NsoK4_00970 [Nitrosopumilus sp. K4]|uniref:hypothetical protein n=1 Tax=Nitrosopumilus sp. K4 TaxID=2795383 RepID=UPI001BA8569D|nr:hypothetical protein [Nitrosopumilus sp. K4]QUC64887.1 hypothetical protein NsoK4_00970 [Nitrosopumilus sp. K4]
MKSKNLLLLLAVSVMLVSSVSISNSFANVISPKKQSSLNFSPQDIVCKEDLVKSQIETIQVGSNKDVPANACRTYDTIIFAKNLDNIFVEILEDVLLD